MKIGFALSLYDKYDDLKVLIDIIRSWNHQYKISVCCSNDAVREQVKKLDVDNVCKPRNVAQLGMHNNSNKNRYAQNIRCTEAVRASCSALTDCDIGVHLHSDAWCLDESFIRKMALKTYVSYAIATRGNGLEDAFNLFRQGVFGTVDDHGIFFDVDWCKERHVWDFKPEAMMYHKYGVHAQLAMVFAIKAGMDNWLYYKSDSVDPFGVKTKSLSPFNFDRISSILHVNTSALPSDWGNALQEKYLRMYGYNYLSEYRDDDVLDKIYKYNKKYDRLLSLCGYSRKRLEAISPVHKKMFLNEITIGKIIKNYRHRIVDYAIDSIIKNPDNAVEWYQNNGYIDELVGKNNWTRKVYE